MRTCSKFLGSGRAVHWQRVNGFTLVELLLVMGLAALLMSAAVPSFRAWALRRAVQQAAQTLVADFRLARSEAIHRAAPVAVCASSDGRSCAAGEGGWAEGWLVFVDRNGNRAVDAGDEVLQVHMRPEALDSVSGPTPSTDKRIFTYLPTGNAKVAAQTFWFTAGAGAPADTARLVCISNQGRPSLRPPGTASCS